VITSVHVSGILGALFWMLLQLSADGQNEFVKNYLKQREQLMSQQMEQKKFYEGSDHLIISVR